VFQAQEERTLRLRADRPIPSAPALISDPSIAREKGPLAGASRPFTGPILGQQRVDCVEEPPQTTISADEWGLSASYGEDRRRKGDQLRQFPQVLGSGRQ
jgi:hypothetical protein